MRLGPIRIPAAPQFTINVRRENGQDEPVVEEEKYSPGVNRQRTRI